VLDQDTQLPCVIGTIGLHGSASTWVFNVVRELMIAAAGEAQVVALYTEELDELPDEATRARRHLIIKSHHGSAALDAWLSAAQARIFLSIRDPRDACLSMSRRFHAPLERAVQWLADDCSRVMRLAEQSQPVLRYEDRFFENGVSVHRLANALGMALAPSVIEAIAARYRTEAVRSFAQALAELPAERLITAGTSHLVDRVTQIHGPHIGDARSGKWCELPAPLQVALTRRFGAFLDRFDYSR
jgi:hypothetical protein